MDLIVPLNAVLSVFKRNAAVVLDFVTNVTRGSTEIPVTEPALVVWGIVQETQGRVRGRVKSANTVHIVTNRAIRTVKADVIRFPECVKAVLTDGLEVFAAMFVLVA